MASVEGEVKQQFARLFVRQDWTLFKRMAEFYLQRAVFLRTGDIKIREDLKLLARNCQKRLFIGIGVELLLKAIYLKGGFSINQVEKGQAGTPAFPFTFAQVADFRQALDKTYTLNDLIEKLSRVPSVGSLSGISRGLKIAKVFRNKEGHAVFPKQKFDASNYRNVEAALVALYPRAFGETLKVRFSFAQGEEGAWKITRSNPALPRTALFAASDRER